MSSISNSDLIAHKIEKLSKLRTGDKYILQISYGNENPFLVHVVYLGVRGYVNFTGIEYFFYAQNEEEREKITTLSDNIKDNLCGHYYENIKDKINKNYANDAYNIDPLMLLSIDEKYFDCQKIKLATKENKTQMINKYGIAIEVFVDISKVLHKATKKLPKDVVTHDIFSFLQTPRKTTSKKGGKTRKHKK